MAQDISQLVVKVTSDGIVQTSNALDKLTTSADKAEVAVKRLGTAWAQAQAGLSTGTGLASSMTGAINALTQAVEKLSQQHTRAASTTRQHNVAMQEAQAAARGLSGSLGALWVTYGNLAGMATGLAIGAALKGVVTTGKDVEQTLETIRVLGESSTAQIKEMKDELLSIGKGAQGPKEVAEAFSVLTLAGLNAKEALIGAGAALNLSTAGGIGIEKSASSLVQVSTALGFTADGFNRIGDVIAKTAAVSMSSVDSISGAFKSAASVGELYGASLTDIGIGLAAVANLGIQGTAAGTSLKNMYKDLASGSEKVTKTLEAMGLKISDLKGADGYFLPLIDVVHKLNDGLEKVNDRQTALGNLQGERGVKSLAALLKLQQTASDAFDENGNRYINKLAEIEDRINKSYGFAAQAAIVMGQTSNNQFKSIGNTIQTSLIKAFDELSPKVGDIARGLKEAFSSPEFINGLKSIVSTIGDLVLWVTKNTDAIKLMVIAFASFKALQIGASFTIAAQGIMATATGLGTATTAAKLFQAALGPIGLTITALTTLWVLYKSKKDAALDISGVNDLKEAAKRLEEYNARLEKNHNLRLQGTSEEQIAADAAAQAQVTAFDRVVEASAANVAKLKADLKAREADMGSFELAAIKRAQRNGTTGGGIAGGIAKEYFDQIKAVNQAEKDHVAVVEKLKNLREESFVKAKRDAEEVEAAAKKARERTTGDVSLNVAGAVKGQAQSLNAEITEIRTQLSKVTADYKQYLDDSKTLVATGDADRRVELENRKRATTEYLAVAQQSYEKELSIAAKYHGKTKEQTAAFQKGMMNASEAYLVSIQNSTAIAMNKDENSVAKKEEAEYEALISSIEKAGEAENKRLTGELKGLKAREEGVNQLKSVQSDYQASVAYEDARQQDLRNQELLDIIAIGDGQRQAAETELKYGQRRIALLNSIGAAYTGIANKQREQEEQTRITKNIDEALAASKRFEKGMVDSFGNVGKAIGGLSVALSQFAKDQDIANVKFKNASEEDKASGKAQLELTNDLTDARITGYANMASSAASFFDKQSKGYKIMEGVSQAFHIAQLARNVASTISGLAAGAAQMFGQSGFGGFAGVAAMTAVVAALGFSGGSGAGGTTSEQAQKTQGTGTVFGDSDAKSESVSKAIASVEANTGILIPISNAMLESLRAIQASMVGLTNLIVRVPGLTNGTNMGVQTGTIKTSGFNTLSSTLLGTNTAGGALGGAGIGFILGGPIGAAIGATLGGVLGDIAGKVVSLWGKTTQNVIDSGIQFSGSIKNLQEGMGFSQYASIDTTKSSFFGLKKSTSNRVETQGLSDELNQQFGLIFQNIEDTLKAAAPSLGKSSEDVVKAIDNFTLPLTQISLKGLKGDELTSAINAVISKSLDDIAKAAFPGYEKFAKVGEGYSETLIRVANDIANVQQVFSILGKTLDLTAGNTADVSESLISVFGSLDNLNNSTKAFTDAYYTDAEKLAPVQTALTAQLGILGASSVKTKEQFKDLVLSQDLTTEAGQKMYASLLAIAPAFSTVAAAADEMVKKRKDLLVGLAVAQGDTGAAERAERESTLAELAKLSPEFAAIKQATYDTIDATQRLEAAKSLEIQMLNAQGDVLAVTAINRKAELDALAKTNPELVAMKQSIYDVIDATAAASAKRSLEVEILKATGREQEANAILRNEELESLKKTNPSLVGLKMALNNVLAAAEDFAKKMTVVDSAFKRLNDSISAEKDRINAEFEVNKEELTKRQQAEKDAAESNHKDILDRIEKEKDASSLAAQEATKAMKELNTLNTKAAQDKIKVLEDLLSTIENSVEATAQYDLAEAHARALSIVRAATASGNPAAFEGITDAVKELAKPTEDLFGTLVEYQISQAQANSALMALQATTEGQLTDAQRSLAALEAAKDSIDKASDKEVETIKAVAAAAKEFEDSRYNQEKTDLEARHKAEMEALELGRNKELKALEDIVKTAQIQIDKLNGIDSSIISLQAAQAQFALAIKNAMDANAAQQAAANAASSAVKPSSNQSFVEGLYQNLLNRAGDAEGIKYWTSVLNNGATTSSVLEGFLNSSEYKNIHPSFAVGTDDVPEDMLANIHKGERIIPAADNLELKRRLSKEDGGDSEQVLLNIKINELIDVIMRGDTANVQKTNDMYRILRDWDGNGLPPVRPEQ